ESSQRKIIQEFSVLEARGMDSLGQGKEVKEEEVEEAQDGSADMKDATGRLGGVASVEGTRAGLPCSVVGLLGAQGQPPLVLAARGSGQPVSKRRHSWLSLSHKADAGATTATHSSGNPGVGYGSLVSNGVHKGNGFGEAEVGV
ncbi:unnamed protein product, partial [Discosporangium mesarthrocarpum]